MKLFNRTASLILGTELLGIRASFNIEAEMSAQTATKAEIKLYNLSPQHLNQIEVGQQNQKIQLSAGYGGQQKLIYRGPIFYAESALVGADTITTCQMNPGALGQTAVFVSIQGAKSSYDILKIVLNQYSKYGIAKGHISPAVIQILQGGGYSSFSDLGLASRFMDQITRRHGLRWNCHNEQINIFNKDEHEDPEMVLLNSESGMIGIPSKTQEKSYKVRSLLNADLVPGKKVRVQSNVYPIKGDLKVIKTTHVGDTLEGDWYTEIEGVVVGTTPGFSFVG